MLNSLSATADGSDYNSGGKISVNGWDITVPSNFQVQFPAAFVGWKNFVAGDFGGHEVSVTGNVVDGKPIAGLIQVSQFLLKGGSGIIESINGAAGSIKIVGGPTIKINDPSGVYGAKYTGLSSFYRADDENPSVSSFSGFPMCIQRDAFDTKCPSSNRPAGQRTFKAPDPLVMAPFQVGDYLEYSGVKVASEIICYTIVAPNVQITTSGVPTYIRVEDSIVGVYDGGATSEFADTRFIGYSSDPTATMTIYALDVDPCTGEETERSVGAALYKAGDIRNKWIWRADSTTFSKYTKEYLIRASTGEKITTNGLTAGRYIQPVTEWIFPEANAPGIVPPPNDFSQFTYLARGSGRDEAGNLWGQLNPWPGASAPATTSCAPVIAATPSSSLSASASATVPTGTPSLAAFTDISTRPGLKVSLKGSATNGADFPSDDLTYLWTQVSGPTTGYKFSSTTSHSPTFLAANTTSKHTVIFNCKITSTLAGTSSSANVSIINDPSVKDTVAIDSYTWLSTQGGTISVTARSNVVDGSATMKLWLQNTVPAGGAGFLTMTRTAPGVFNYMARSIKKPGTGISVQTTVQGTTGGTASKTTTTARRRRRGLAGVVGI